MFRSSALSRLVLLVSCLLVAPAHAQPRAIGAAEPAVPSSAPVRLSTREPQVEWGTVERRPEPIASNAVGPVVGGAGGGSAEDPYAKVAVKGLKGTLNKDDVHQTMDGRQRALNRCIAQAQRGLEWVSGNLQFAFKVDAEGRVIQLHPLSSSVGHLELEQCVTQVVVDTQFPRPAGRAAAEFTWGLSVDPPGKRSLRPRRSSGLAASMRKHRKEVWKECELPRRARFKVTAYLAPSGGLLSAGATATPPAAQEKAACVIEQLSKMHLPKQKRVEKVSFDVR
jgi:hypothetical protein